MDFIIFRKELACLDRQDEESLTTGIPPYRAEIFDCPGGYYLDNRLQTQNNNGNPIIHIDRRISDMTVPKRREREKPKKFEEHAVSIPVQLEFFFLTEKESDYSNTVELYDFMPKYVWSKQDRINDQFLERITRTFEFRGREFQLKMDPARLEDKDGVVREYFPGIKEEHVEDILRKMMTEGYGVMLDGEAGIRFTLYQLQQELADHGHTYSYDQIKNAIQVLKGTDIYLEASKTGDQDSINIAFSPIETYGFKDNGDETQTFVRFSPLVTRSIKQQSYRMINYKKVNEFSNDVIARQLYKRLSHVYTYAKVGNTFNIMLTTLIRDFGLTFYEKLGQNAKQVEKALEVLKTNRVLNKYEAIPVFEKKPRKKLTDVKYILHPDVKFVSDIIDANNRQREIKNQLKAVNNS
jgi:hypothetical protein